MSSKVRNIVLESDSIIINVYVKISWEWKRPPPWLLLSNDWDCETFSDIEEKEKFESDFQFGVKDFCVVKFETEEKNSLKHCVGQILEIDKEAYKFKFFKKKAVGNNKF